MLRILFFLNSGVRLSSELKALNTQESKDSLSEDGVLNAEANDNDNSEKARSVVRFQLNCHVQSDLNFTDFQGHRLYPIRNEHQVVIKDREHDANSSAFRSTVYITDRSFQCGLSGFPTLKSNPSKFDLQCKTLLLTLLDC